MKFRVAVTCLTMILIGAVAPVGASPTTTTAFANFENSPVRPLDLHPTSGILALANLPAGRLDLFDVSGASPALLPGGMVPVGVDPTAVKFRPGTNEAWVVNKISDSISVVDVVERKVLHTIRTGDDPADIVFAGNPLRAYVTCSLPNEVQVFNPETRTRVGVVKIAGNRPRSMTVSPDGSKVHIALFESGNRTTIIGGGHLTGALAVSFPPDATANAASPYNGQTPPPNDGTGFFPPQNPHNTAAPNVGIIVRQAPDGRWLDDNNGDWTHMVSGPQAALSGRVPGWQLLDRDIATLDTASWDLTYTGDLMNIVMGLATDATGRVFVVGTDGRNEVRFEPNLNGRFLDVLGARVSADQTTATVANLNGPDYGSAIPLPMPLRERAVGDPRAVLVSPDGQTVFVAGMGSSNLTRFDAATMERIGTGAPLKLDEGPAGLAFDPATDRIYVYNRFGASLSVVDPAAWAETARVAIHDPTPQPIRFGRQFLYDTVEYSGPGHVSCGSCHIDARMDRLAWDLGDPAGEMSTVTATTHNIGRNLGALATIFADSHPMKGPMITQTLQDIIGMEPLHWRADRLAFEDFNGTFIHLQANDTVLTPDQMAGFKAFVDTIIFPPNPHRDITNAFPPSIPLPGEFSTGRFSPVGTPMPPGRPAVALGLYTSGVRRLDANVLSCAACHTVPTGAGTNMRWNTSLGRFEDIFPGPRGESKVAVVGVDGSQNITLKVPQLRNMAERNGQTLTTATTVGFGFVHDGSIDSLVRFFSDTRFRFNTDQELADMVALMLAFSGSDMADGGPTNSQNPPGPKSDDSPAGTGRQYTYSGGPPADILTTMTSLAISGTSRLDLIAKANVNGLQRGWWYDRVQGIWLSDRNGETATSPQLLAKAGPSNPMSFTLVLRGTGRRLGIDADLDGHFDRTERDTGSDWLHNMSAPPRATLAFSTGNDALPSTTTVVAHPKSVVSNLEPLVEVAATVWQVETTRTGWTTATLALNWLPADVAGFSPGQIAGMKIFTAPEASGPWTAIPSFLNVPQRLAVAEVSHFSWFAIAQATVPVSLSDFGID